MTNIKELFPESGKKPASHRQQRVAEELRQILAELITRGDIPVSELQNALVTITHVDISPDLRNAKIFLVPLGQQKSGKGLARVFNENASTIRYMIAKKLTLKFCPTFKFFYDDAFERAEKIEALFDKIRTNPNDSDETE